MTVEVARHALFGDALACEEMRPAAVLPALPDEGRRRAALIRAEALMRALAVVEESRADEVDDRNPVEQSVRRLEAKVDLLVGLVAGLLQRDQPADPTRLLQWSVRGVAIELPAAEASLVPGGGATFRVQPSDALPEPILLPVRVLAIEPSPAGRRIWLGFDEPGVALEDLLERHLFRVHRRAIAGTRRPR